jgi:hypothetical protein
MNSLEQEAEDCTVKSNRNKKLIHLYYVLSSATSFVPTILCNTKSWASHLGLSKIKAVVDL